MIWSQYCRSFLSAIPHLHKSPNVIRTWQMLEALLLIISWAHLTCCQKAEITFQKRTRGSSISSVKARSQSPGDHKSKRKINSVPQCGLHALIPLCCPKCPLDFRNVFKVLLLRPYFLQDLDGRKGASQGHGLRRQTLQ